jgi:glycosyltransferase involved in cell wall biosynthesis
MTMPRLWLDVEDLLRYQEEGHRRPTGIQRGNFELYRALREEYGDQVQFLRHHPAGGLFVVVPWEAITDAFEALTASADEPAAPPAAAGLPFVLRGRARRMAERIPPAIRLPLGRIGRGQIDTLRALPALVVGLARWVRAVIGARHADDADSEHPTRAYRDFAADVRPGDAVAIMGTPLFRTDYDALAETVRRRHGVRFGMLVHDLVPARRPEWAHTALVEVFESWMQRVLPLCDAVFAFSRATATDVERYAQEHGITLSRPVTHVPHGQRRGGPLTAAPVPTPRLPAPGSYVLFVSTIEPRKNHMMLFRAWRRLLEQMPKEQVPLLVFAGGVGWLVGDLLQQFENASWLDGHIVFIRSPDDAELAALYQGSLFTIYPSLFEGWGLPVTESLAFGKPCLASNMTSLPEAGGALARYFDPEDLTAATAAIRAVIEDPDGLASWHALVQAEFRPVPWARSARAVGDAFGLQPVGVCAAGGA